MKAISVCQPWAYLIVGGDKAVENRSWPTNYRGELLIHAGKSTKFWTFALCEQLGMHMRDPRIAYGAIVGRCRLIDCVRVEEARRRGLAYADGPWCWILAERARYLVPHPYRGSLGLFDVPPAVTSAIGLNHKRALEGGAS